MIPSVAKVQHDHSCSYVEADQYSDCYTGIDVEHTTAKNPANIIASVIQYKAGLFFIDSSIVISIS